jgi:hypothetical protein
MMFPDILPLAPRIMAAAMEGLFGHEGRGVVPAVCPPVCADPPPAARDWLALYAVIPLDRSTITAAKYDAAVCIDGQLFTVAILCDRLISLSAEEVAGGFKMLFRINQVEGTAVKDCPGQMSLFWWGERHEKPAA